MSTPTNPLTSGAALDSLARRYGGDFEFREDILTALTTGPTQIVPFDAERIALVIVNLGGNTVMVAPSDAVSATRGILLAPNGGGVAFSENEDGLLTCLRWSALAIAGNSDVYALTTKRIRQI